MLRRRFCVLMFARLIFFMDFGAREGLSAPDAVDSVSDHVSPAKQLALCVLGFAAKPTPIGICAVTDMCWSRGISLRQD